MVFSHAMALRRFEGVLDVFAGDACVSGAAALDFAALIAPHPELTALWRLWEQVRGGRALPSRRDFTPERLRTWLGNLALIDVRQDPVRLQYRLVGTHIVDNLKCDPTGRDFESLFKDPPNNPLSKGLYRCLSSRQPVFEVVPSRLLRCYAFDCTRLALPLAADGLSVNMILSGEYLIAGPAVGGARCHGA